MSMIDNMRKRNQAQRREPTVEGPPREPVGPQELEALARNIRGGIPASQRPEDYAPPVRRLEEMEAGAMRVLQKFAELPVGEIDGIMARAKAEYERLFEKAQQARETFHNDMQEISADFEHFIAAVKISQDHFSKLVDECAALNHRKPGKMVAADPDPQFQEVAEQVVPEGFSPKDRT